MVLKENIWNTYAYFGMVNIDNESFYKSNMHKIHCDYAGIYFQSIIFFT